MNRPTIQESRNTSNKILLQPEVIAKLRQEIERLRRSDSPEVLRFVDTMVSRYAELRP